MKVAILGGGVAGLASAIALEQGEHGLDIEVYERHPARTEIGAGIVCWPNASFVLEQLGVLDELTAVSSRVTAMERLSSAGEGLGALDIEELDGRMGYPSLAVLRSDLMRILEDRLAELGKHVRYDSEVERLESNEDRARVVFTGGETCDADWILGAEGRMRSLARAFVVGHATPRYQGFVNWIGTFSGDTELFERAVRDYWGIGERFGIVPVSRSAAYWAGGAASRGVFERDPSRYRDELTVMFASWTDPIPRLIRESVPSSINKIYVHDHDPIEVWHRENVLLIGDAAHAALPTSGQGACQALEDAWHLERLLRELGPSAEAVFGRFTDLRREKTSGMISGGRQLAASLFDTDRERCRTRNEKSRNTDYSAAVVGMARGWSSGLPISHAHR